MKWLMFYNKGFIFYTQNNYREAARYFEQSLKLCPENNLPMTVDILYLIGDSLVRLSRPGAGLKFWKTALRYCSCADEAAEKILARINSYGMLKRLTSVEDDFAAFRAVQVRKYLENKISGSFDSSVEKEMVFSSIDQQFKKLSASDDYNSFTDREKLELFDSFRIMFPFFIKETREKNSVIFYDFVQQNKVESCSSCPCGSGLEYSVCCGSIDETDILFSGGI